MIKNIPHLISAIIIGVILFQSFLIAPAINKLISVKEASIFLRYIWPKFFLIIGFLSLTAFIFNFNNGAIKYFLLTSSLLMFTCYFVTPIINEAKDLNNEKLWHVLHLLTVFLTLITLILNFLFIFFFKPID